MPKYWVKNYFAHGRFPEVGQKQKTEKKRERKREREKERLNNGDNNGQATHGARKHAWRTQAAWAKSNQIRRQRVKERRAKVSVNNVQYICLDQLNNCNTCYNSVTNDNVPLL